MSPVKDIMTQKLTEALNPVELVIDNTSDQHKGHAGDNGTGESHFDVLIVSEKFENLSRVSAQRLVYDILADELKERIHALSLTLKTPA